MPTLTPGFEKTLILLPGLDGTGRLFGPLQQALEPKIRTSAIAYPIDRKFDYDALCDRVWHDLPESPFAILAESFSGPLALKVAARGPHWLRALILSASFVADPCPVLLRPFYKALNPLYSWLQLPDWAIRAWLTGDSAPRELRRKVQEVAGPVPLDVLAFRLEEALNCDVTGDLEKCPVPITYLNGTRDRLLSKRALRTLQSVRPDVQVINIPGPHMLLQTATSDCARHIGSALDNLDWERS